MDKLKPCPFCGGDAEIARYGTGRYSTKYECTECGCILETGETFNHGEAWNTRVKDAKDRRKKMSKDRENEYHVIVTKIYNSDGECIGISNATVAGEHEPNEATKKYWAWLDKRRHWKL